MIQTETSGTSFRVHKVIAENKTGLLLISVDEVGYSQQTTFIEGELSASINSNSLEFDQETQDIYEAMLLSFQFK
jgi:hypothetical protein